MGTFVISRCFVNLPSYCEFRFLSTCLTVKPNYEQSKVQFSLFLNKQQRLPIASTGMYI